MRCSSTVTTQNALLALSIYAVVLDGGHRFLTDGLFSLA
jgi:hypothetical protein